MNVAGKEPEISQVSERGRALSWKSEFKAVNLSLCCRHDLVSGLAADLSKEDCEVVSRREHETSSSVVQRQGYGFFFVAQQWVIIAKGRPKLIPNRIDSFCWTF